MEQFHLSDAKVQPWKRLLSEDNPNAGAMDICTMSDKPWIRLQLAEEARANTTGPRQLRYPDYELYRRADPFPQIYKAELGRREPPGQEDTQQPFTDSAWDDAIQKLELMQGTEANVS
ncbi:hypothetical protein PG993_014817 [Apiospora rasikravindrae]|uniref:Uncharacterized protein n=1 Tax=Apiospora rasikravindrae TaxID=990691 RepID=A0ABR1RNY5_9PEZI